MDFCIEIGTDNVPFIQLGKYKLRIDLEDLDEDYKERAKNELRETPEIVENALQILREHITGEPQLHLPVEDTGFLLKFLRPTKFYPDKAFKVLKKFYKFKFANPHYGDNITPETVRAVFEAGILQLLPTRTPAGTRILVINPGNNWNPKIVALGEIVKGVIVAIEIAMLEPKTQVAGVEVIINMEGFSLTHLLQFSPSLAKLIVDCIQSCLPLRVKGIHTINQGFLFNVIYVMFKPFIGEKLRKRICFHGSNRKTLCDKLSADAIPKRLGGTSLPECPGKLLVDLFYYYEEDFHKVATYRYTKT